MTSNLADTAEGERASVETLRHECAANGPCSDYIDGCSCTDAELQKRHASVRSKPAPQADSATINAEAAESFHHRMVKAEARVVELETELRRVVATMSTAPQAEGGSEALPEVVVTENSASGKYWVEIKCATLKDMHRWSNVVMNAYRASKAARPVDKGEGTADAEGWIEWNGGECPVDGGLLVTVKFRDDFIADDMVAGALLWGHNGRRADILAYRLTPTQGKDEG